MYFLDDLKQKIKVALNLEKANFSYPPETTLGDLSLAVFELASQEKKSPAILATELATRLSQDLSLKEYFQTVKAVGPYLNFFLQPEYLATALINEVKNAKDSYGQNTNGQNQRVMIEYSNGNTHKEYHVGHLRNISYGDAINRLLTANGYAAIPVSYINDFGIHVAKTLWEWQNNPEFQASSENRGYLLGKCYVAATQALEKEPEKKEVVGQIMKEIESRQGASYELWQKTRAWSIKYFAQIYKELGVKFTHIFYENEMIDAGLKLVEELKEKKVLVKSEGAIIADLDQFGLGVLPIIRSDGTALYPVGDLALALTKFQQYGLDESIYVVDVRQSLYFKQLFKILELMGDTRLRLQLAYDFVTLPEGMMSSRTGNVITYEELKEKIQEKLSQETKKRHLDWTKSRIAMVADSLTASTIKFELLKVSAEKIITFNIEEALKFDGYTACYLQYGYARLKSIIRKEAWAWSKPPVDLKVLKEPKERELLMKVAKYPEIIALAGQKFNPSEVTRYLFELTQLFNDYYHEINILKAEPALRHARLALIKAIAQVLANGFKVLGLKILEEM